MRERVTEAQGTAACPGRAAALSARGQGRHCTPDTSPRVTRVISALRRKKTRDKQRKSQQKKIDRQHQHTMSSVFLKFFSPISGHQQKFGCGYGKNDDDTMMMMTTQ